MTEIKGRVFNAGDRRPRSGSNEGCYRDRGGLMTTIPNNAQPILPVLLELIFYEGVVATSGEFTGWVGRRGGTEGILGWTYIELERNWGTDTPVPSIVIPV